ncbi:MAG: TOBE domain-containing protein, partial [Fimbriimonas ginsengisoli]|nr:TOBE domain-containing protein [Fimbriimonas ginsengisoli]
VFLMDEPLSNLDAQLRVQTRAELIRLHRRLGVTTIYVTHDQVEAMTMGQRIAILKDGVLLQCDTPETIYARPANQFVAGFIGSPSMNFFPATVRGSVLEASGLKLPLPKDHPAAKEGRAVTVGLRPEAIFDAALPSALKPTSDNTFEATVDVMEPLGHEYVAYLAAGSINMVATLDNATKLREGQTAKFVANLDELHVFDAGTGDAIR